MSLPKKLYRLEVKKGEGKSMRYAERGGGTFSSLADMRYRIEKMRRAGRQVRVFECEPEWHEIKVPE
jgi:hypothetical protein